MGEWAFISHPETRNIPAVAEDPTAAGVPTFRSLALENLQSTIPLAVNRHKTHASMVVVVQNKSAHALQHLKIIVLWVVEISAIWIDHNTAAVHKDNVSGSFSQPRGYRQSYVWKAITH